MECLLEKVSLDAIEDKPGYLEQIKISKWAEERWANDILNYLFRDEKPGKEKILEAGSGGGLMCSNLVRIARQKGRTIEVIGLDKSLAMTSYAQKKLKRKSCKKYPL